MNEEKITGGENVEEPPKKVNVLDVLATGMSPEDFIGNAIPGIDAEIDSPDVIYEKIGKNFKSKEEFAEFYTVATDIADGYNYANQNKRPPARPSFWKGTSESSRYSPVVTSKSFRSAPYAGGKWMVSPRQIAREKGIYLYKDLETGIDREVPLDPGSLKNPFNNYVIDEQSNGDPYLRLKHGSEYDPAYQKYSVWGNDNLYGMSIFEPFINFAQEAITAFPEMYAFGAKIGITDPISSLAVPNVGAYDIIWNEALNSLDRMKWQASDSVIEGGWLDHGLFSKSLLYNFMGGLGILAPQRFAAWGAGKLVAKSAPKFIAKTSGKVIPGRLIADVADDAVEGVAEKTGKVVTKEGIGALMAAKAGQRASQFPQTFTEYNYQIQKAIKQAATTATVSVGTLQASKGFYDEALIAGLSEEDATWMTFLAMPAVALTELLLSAKYLTKGIGDDAISPTTIFGNSSAMKMFKAAVAKDLPQFFKANGKPLTSEKAKTSMINAIIANALKPILGAAQKVSVVPVAGGALREGVQEWSEQLWYVGQAKLWNKYTEGKDKGYFKGKKGEALSKELRDNFWAGFMLGGFMDGVTGTYKNKKQDMFVQSMIINGQEKELDAIVATNYKKQDFGVKGLNWKGVQEVKGEAGSGIIINKNGELDKYGVERNTEIRTLNDMNFFNFVQKIEIFKNAYNMGVHNVDSITAYGESPSIVTEVMDTTRAIISVQSEIKDLNEKLEVAKKENVGTTSGIESEIMAKSEELALLENAYDEATKVTEPDAEGNLRYTKRANDKLAEVLFSEVKQKKVTINDINEQRKGLTDFSLWKAQELEKAKRVLDYRNRLQEKTEKLTFSGKMEDVDNLITELTSLDNESRFEGFGFNTAHLSPEAKQAYENVRQGIESLITNGKMHENALSKIKGKKDLREVKVQSEYEAFVAQKINPESLSPEISNYYSLRNLNDQLKNIISTTPSGNVNVDIPIVWDEKTERQKALEYLLTVDIGGNRIDAREALMDIIKNLDNATEVDLANVKRIAEGLAKNEALIALAENINMVNVRSGRRVINTKPTDFRKENLDESGNPKMFGDEFDSSSLAIASFTIDQYFNNMVDYVIDPETKQVELARDEKGDVLYYPGIHKLIEQLEGTISKRAYREMERRRGRIFRFIDMAEYVTQKSLTLGIFDNSIKQLASLQEFYDKIFDPKQIPDEKVTEIENKMWDVYSALHKDIIESGKITEFLTFINEKVLEETGKYFSQTNSDPSTTLDYKGYTPVRDNYGIESDDFVRLPFNSFHNIMEFIRTRETHKDILPEKYDYSDIATRDAIMSLWNLEITNFFNNIVQLDVESFLVDYNAVKQKLENMPSLQQENAILMTYALSTKAKGRAFAAKRADLSLFGIQDKEKETDSAWSLNNFPIDGLFIQAINGGGKTTVVMQTSFLMIDNFLDRYMKETDMLNITLVSPTMKLSNKLKKQFEGTKHFNIKAILRSDFEADVTAFKDQDIVIYDEATTFAESKLKEFVDFYGKETNPRGLKVKFIFLGDPTQSRNEKKKKAFTTSTIPGSIVPRTTTISEVFRTEGYDLYRTTVVLQKSIIGAKTSVDKIKFATSTYTPAKTEGVMFVKNAVAARAQWLMDQSLPGLNRILVFRNAVDRSNFIKEHPELSPQQQQNVRFINETEEANDNENKAAGGSIQGDEVDAVYVAFDLVDNDIFSFVDYKTAVGRATDFAVLPFENGLSVPADNILKTNIDEKALEKEKTDKKVRVEYFAKGRTPVAKTTQSSATSTTKKPTKKDSKKDDKIVSNDPQSATKQPTNDVGKVTLTKLQNAAVQTKITDSFIQDDGNIYQGISVVPFGEHTYVIYDIISPEGTRTIHTNKSNWDKMVRNHMPVQQEANDDVHYDQNPIITNQLRTAQDYVKSGLVRFSAGSSDTTVPFTPAFYAQLSDILQHQSDYNITAEFLPEVKLYDQADNIQKPNYKVIAVYATNKSTGNRTMIGSFYQPYLNPQDLELNFGKRSLSEHEYENVNANYPQTQVGAAELNQFNTFLQQMYYLAQAHKGPVVVGKGYKIEFSGGQARVNYDSPVSVSNLLSTIFKKGGRVLIKDGTNYRYANSLTYNEYSQIVVQQAATDKGYVTPSIFVSYTAYPVHLDFESAMRHSTRVEISGVKYSQDSQSSTALNEDIGTLKSDIREASDIDMQSMINKINSLISKSLFHKALNYNRWIFRDRTINAKDTVYNLSNEWNDKLEMSKTFLGLADPQLKDTSETKRYYIDLVEELAGRILSEGYSYQDVSIPVGTGLQFMSLGKSHFDTFTTPVTDLYAPVLRMAFEQSIKKPKNKPGKGNNATGEFNGAQLMDMSIPRGNMVSAEISYNNLINFFGESFFNNSLDISPNPILFGKEGWGAVNNFRMMIYEQNGRVMEGAEIHEAVHYAMRYFIHPDSMRKILDDSKLQMAADGYAGEISDGQAHEWLAEVARGAIKPKVQRKLPTWKRFVNWFLNLFNSAKQFTLPYESFIADLKSGSFIDAKVKYDNVSETQWMGMEDDQTNVNAEDVYNEDLDDVNYDRFQTLYNHFGDNATLKSAIGAVRAMIVSRLSFYPAVMSTRSMDFSEAIDDTFNSIVNSTSQRLVAQKLKDREMFDLLIEHMLPSFNLSTEVIEEVFTSNYETKDINLKRNLSQALRFVIKSIPKHSFKLATARSQGPVLQIGDSFVEITHNQSNIIDAERVDWLYLHDAMIQASRNVNMHVNANNEEAIDQWLHNLRKMAVGYLAVGDNVEAANTILSFLTFAGLGNSNISTMLDYVNADSSNNNPGRTIPLRNMVDSQGLSQIVRFASGNPNMTEEDIYTYLSEDPHGMALMKRAKAASELLNAVATYATNIISNSAAVAEAVINSDRNKANSFFINLKSSNVFDSAKTKLKHGMEFAIYVSDMVKHDVWTETSGINNPKSTYKIDPDTKTISINLNNGTFRPFIKFNGKIFEFVEESVEYPAASIISDIRGALSFLGLHNVPFQIVTRAYETKSTGLFSNARYEVAGETRNAIENGLSKNGLASLIGGALTVIRTDKSYIESQMDKKGDLPKYLRENLENIPALRTMFGEVLTGQEETFETANEDKVSRQLTKQQQKGNTKLAKDVEAEKNIKVTSFDFLLNGLAIMESAMNARKSNYFTVNATGSKIYLQNTKTSLDLVIGEDINYLNEPLKGKPSPLTKIPMRRLAVQNNVFRITKKVKVVGIQAFGTGKDVDQFTRQDNINIDLFAQFMSGLYLTKSLNRQTIPIVIPNPGDSKQRWHLHVQIDSRKGGFRLLEFDPQNNRYVMPEKGKLLLNVLFDMQMDFHFAMHESALAQFENVELKSLESGESINPFLNVFQQYNGTNDINAFVENQDMLSGILASRPFAEWEQAFIKAGLIKGVHYNIKDGVAVPGTMAGFEPNRDNIYNRETYFDWKAGVEESGLDLSEHSEYLKSPHLIKKETLDKMQPLNDMRNVAFWKSYRSLKNVLISEGYNNLRIPEYVTNSNVEYEPGKMGYFKNTDRSVNGERVREYNPVLETFMSLYHFVSQDITSEIMGDTSQMLNTNGETDIVKYGKYFKGIVSQGSSQMILRNSAFGMSQVRNVAILQDVESVSHYAELFGLNKKNVHTDGLILSSDLMHQMFSHGVGGSMGIVRPTDKSVKSITQEVRLDNGLGIQIKSSKIVQNRDMYDHAPTKFISVLKFMYDRPVKISKNEEYNPFERWYHFYTTNDKSVTMANQMLYDDIAKMRIATGIDVAQNIVHEIVFKSTVKYSAQYENTQNIDNIYADMADPARLDQEKYQDYSISKLDPRLDRVMLNANQPITNITASAPIQFEELIGNVRMDVLNGLIALKNANIQGIKIRQNPKKYQQGILYNMMKSREDSSLTTQLVMSKNVSMSIPLIFGGLVPNISARFKKGIHKKATGRKLVQYPSENFIEYYDVQMRVPGETEQTVPIRVNYAELMRDQQSENPLYIVGENPVPSPARPTDYRDKDGNDISQMIKDEHPELIGLMDNRSDLRKEIGDIDFKIKRTKNTKEFKELTELLQVRKKEYEALNSQIESIRKPYLAKLDHITPSEVAMEWLHFDLFGINREMNYSLNEILTVRFKDGTGINAREFVKQNSKNYYKNHKDGILALEMFLLENKENIDESSIVVESLNTLHGFDITNATNWFDHLLQSLLVFSVRVPTSLWGSASVGEITSFTYDSPSIIYSSHEKNVLDDSDYDIDQLTVYFRNIGLTNGTYQGFNYSSVDEAMMDMEYLINNATEGDLENIKFQMYYDFMMDTRTAEMKMSSFDIESAKQYAERISPENEQSRRFRHHEYASMLNNHQIAHDGTNLVPYTANAIHVMGTLMHMTERQKRELIPGLRLPASGIISIEDVFGKSETYLAQELAIFLQLAVDNIKHMTSGRLNLNTVSINIANALIINGKSGLQTFDVLNDPVVKKLIDKVVSSTTIDQYTINLYKLVNDELQYFTTINSDEHLAQVYQERIDSLNKEIRDISESLAGMSSREVEALYPVDGGSPIYEVVQQDNDEGTHSELMAKLKELEAELQSMIETGMDAFIEMRNAQTQDIIQKLNLLSESYVTGEFLHRLSQAMSLYNTLPSSHANNYSMRRMLEFSTRTRLEDIPMVHDPSVMTQKVNLTIDEAFREKEMNNRIRVLPGANQIGVVPEFYEKSQPEINAIVTDFLSRAMQKVMNTSIKGVQIKDLVEFTAVNGGQLGIDMAGGVATTSLGIPTIVFMPKGFRHRTAEGVDISTKTREQIIQMYGALDNPDLLTIMEVGKDIQLPNPQYYQTRTKHVVEKADHVLSINVNENSPGMILTNRLAEGKMTKLNAYDFVGDEKLAESVDKFANDLIAKIKSLKELADKANFGDKIPFVLNIAGNGIDNMQSRDMTEAEEFIEFEKKIDAVGNVLGIIRSNRALNAYYTVWNQMNSHFADMFYQMNPYILELAEKLSIDVGGIGVLSEKNYVRLINAVDAAFAMRFLENKYGDKKLNLYSWGDYKKSKTVTSSRFRNLDQLPEANLKLANPQDINKFIIAFPHVVQNYKQKMFGDTNPFLNRLIYDPFGNILIDDVQNLSPEEMVSIQEGFSNMDPKMKELFALYNLIAVGFKNNMRSMGPVIEMPFYEEYSEELTKEQENFKDPQSKLRKDFKANFIDNTVSFDDAIVNRVRAKRLDMLVNRPKYAHVRYVYTDIAGRPVYTEYYNLMRYNPAWEGRDGLANTMYTKVNNQMSGRIKGVMPISVPVTTQLDVIKNIDPQQMHLWSTEGRASIYTRKVHHYSVTVNFPTFVRVFRDYAKVVSATETSIVLQKVNQSDVTNERKKYIDAENAFLAENPDYVPKQVNDSRLIHDGLKMPVRAFRSVMNMLIKANPDLQIVEVTNATTDRPGTSGYYSAGVFYYNTDLMTFDTPVHELMHPILLSLINSENAEMRAMGEMFLDLAQLQITNNTELYNQIRSYYPDLSPVDLKLEIAATISGLVSEEKVKQYVEDSKTVWDSIRDFVSSFWNSIKTVWDNIFSFTDVKDNYDATYQRTMPEYSIDSRYKDMINHVIDMAFDGKADLLMSDINDLAWNKVYDKRITINPINDIKVLENELLLGGDQLLDINAIRGEFTVNAVYSELYRNPDKIYNVGNESFDMTEYMVEGRKLEAINKIRQDILPVIEANKSKVSEQFAEFMNGNDYYSREAIQEAFTIKTSDGRSIVMFSTRTIRNAISLMEFNQDSRIFRLSKLKELSNVYPGLADKIQDGFNGVDPYVVIHRKKKTSKGEVYDISLFDITSADLSFNGRGLSSDALITDNFVDTAVAKKAGVYHRADLRSARQVMLTMQMMSLKKNIPSINIRKAGIIELVPYRGSRRNAGSLKYTPINLNFMAPVVRAIKNSTRFSNVTNPKIMDVLNIESLYDPETYNPDYISMIQDSWHFQVDWRMNNYGDDDKGAKILRERLDVLESYLNGKGTVYNLLQAVRLQKQYLERTQDLMTDDAKYSSIEYRMLAHMENQLTAYSTDGHKSHMNRIVKLFATAYQQPNELIQNFNNIQFNLFALIVDRYKQETEKLDEMTKPLIDMLNMDRAKRLFVDTSDDYFRNMFIKETIEGVERNMGRLHWTKDDPKTRQALRDGTITEEHIKYANFILDLVEKHMKGLLRQKYVNENRFTMSKDGAPDMELINKAVDFDFAKNWDRGLVPVMTKTPNQMIMTMKGPLIIKGISKFIKKISNPQSFFSELVDLNPQTDNAENIYSLFLNQIGPAQDPRYGSDARLNALGLELNNSTLRVKDESQNDALSFNLYTTMKYLIMDNVQKEVVENDLLPAYNNARLIAKELSMTKSKEDYDVVLEYLTEVFAQNIAGRHTISAKEEKNLEKSAALARFSIFVTTFTGVALSVPVMLTSATANTFERLSNAAANTVANPYDMATLKEELQAVVEIGRNFKKVKILEGLYQTIESDRTSQLEQQKYDLTRLNVFDANFWHYGNRITDLTARRVAFVAQMIHDGTWEAHDDEGNYNVKQDKRFFTTPTSKQTEEQEALMQSLVKDLIDDRYPGQKNNVLPMKAYSYTEQRKLMMVGTEFGIGVFEKEMAPVGNNHLWYSAFMQFKKFTNAAIGSRIMEETTTVEGGKRAIKKINGVAVRDQFGKLVVEFQNMHRGGTWRTSIRLGGEMLAAAPIIGDFMVKVGMVTQPRTMKEIMNMTPLERRNLAKACIDVVTFVTAYLVYMGMVKDTPEDKKDLIKKYGRLVRAIKNGFDTSMIASPISVIDMATNIALLQNARRVITLFTLGPDAGKEISYLAPFGGTARVAYDIFKEE